MLTRAGLALGVALLWTLLVPNRVSADPRALVGSWRDRTSSSDDPCADGADPPFSRRFAAPSRLGGSYVYVAPLYIERSDRYVIDFKNSSTLGRFRHCVFAASGQLVARLEGGIQSDTANPFLLRHGRTLSLESGSYRVVSHVSSPFFLGHPMPFVDTFDAYCQAIKLGNVMVLLCLGMILGLGIYYAELAFSRKRRAELMYTLFLLGNLLYNGSALLVYPDVFAIHWFYLVSFPILFSNMAYVAFVMALLKIRASTHPGLYWSGKALLIVLAAFALWAFVQPNLSLELDRYGVALFLTYGVVTGTVRAREGDAIARSYLLAVAAFFVLAMVAITIEGLHTYTFYVEHVGLVAVAVEFVLLARVLARQFAP